MDAPNVIGKNHERKYLPGPMYGPYSFINIDHGMESFDSLGRSRKNEVEIVVILQILRNLHKGDYCSIHKFIFTYEFFFLRIFY